MTKTDFLGRGWKFPLSLEKDEKSGYVSLSTAEGEDSIRESILIILRTVKGERVMRPDFGCKINEYTFELNNTSTSALISFHVKEALQQWEPRIEVMNVNVTSDETEGNKIYINIDYKVKTSNSKRNLVYPFYLAKAGG